MPAAVFAVLYARSKAKRVALCALAWGAYAAYEYGMQQRWLCSGECNIRVDLLMLYPLLAVLSLLAVVAAERALRRSKP